VQRLVSVARVLSPTPSAIAYNLGRDFQQGAAQSDSFAVRRIRDPFGHLWVLSCPLFALSAEETQRQLETP
jgi:hypothetical protein